MRVLVSVILIVSSIFAFSQVQRLALTERIADDKISKSLAILPVYRFTGYSIEPYTMFGIEEKPDLAPLHISRLPDMKACSDTGYTYVFFGGANSAQNQGYLLTIIGNYRRSMRTVYFFVDRNNNLDLNDDGPPDSMLYKQDELFIKLQNTANPVAEHQVKLSRIEYGENIAYKKLLTEHYQKHSGSKEFTNINFCYREQRYNTLSAVFSTAQDSFRIALKDMNNNGLFNEACVDKFYQGGAEGPVETDIMTYLLPRTENMQFEWNGKRYRLLSVSASGNELQFEQMPEAPLKKGLKTGRKIPKFSFVTLDNERLESKSLKKKKTYLFFWDLQSLSDEDTLYLSKLHREFPGSLNLRTFNHGDEPNRVRRMRYYDEVQWPMAFSSVFLSRLFALETLPRGFYTGKRLKLYKANISPRELYELLHTDSP